MKERMPPEQPSLFRVIFFSILGNVTIIVAGVICGGIATVVGFLPPRGFWMYQIARLWSWVTLASSGIPVTATFEERLDPEKGYVFLANHQSLFDIPVLIKTLPGQARFLAKRGLFWIPFFGWGLWAGGFIPVDRKNRQAAQETFRIAERTLRRGFSILLFPEETRSPTGELLPFKRGGTLLAQKTGFEVVPIGIRGTFDIKPKGKLHLKPRPVEIHYGRPIPSNEPDLNEKVRAEIARLAGLEVEPK
jgi:1-acyl-sn-glycerol-3-phosphate acyltransferase